MKKLIILGIVGIVAVGGYFVYKMTKNKDIKEPDVKPNGIPIDVPNTMTLPSNINTSNVKVTGSAVVSNYVGFDGAINARFNNY